MNKILVTVLTLLFVSTISCKENVNYEKELKKVGDGITDSLNALKIVEYKEIKLECVGEEFSASKCVNEAKNLSITFDKKFVSFSIDSTEFIHQNIQFPKELGYESFLFVNKNDKIIILDFFLENGANIYAYRYHEHELKFLGQKEIILDEDEENAKTFSVEQIGEDVIVSLGKNIKNLHFNFAGAIDLKVSSDLSLSDKMKENLKTPEEITRKLIFTRDIKGKLNIDTDILAYISKYTTSKNNTYVLSLEKYVIHQIDQYYEYNNRQWSEEELVKIVAYASNTTDPLHKKYWKDSSEQWHNGMWGNILSYCYLVYPKTFWLIFQKQSKKENFYNLPHLKEMISYASDFDKFGPP